MPWMRVLSAAGMLAWLSLASALLTARMKIVRVPSTGRAMGSLKPVLLPEPSDHRKALPYLAMSSPAQLFRAARAAPSSQAAELIGIDDQPEDLTANVFISFSSVECSPRRLPSDGHLPVASWCRLAHRPSVSFGNLSRRARTQRSKEPGVPQRILAAPSPR